MPPPWDQRPESEQQRAEEEAAGWAPSLPPHACAALAAHRPNALRLLVDGLSGTPGEAPHIVQLKAVRLSPACQGTAFYSSACQS